MNERIKQLSKQAWESITVQDALADEAFDQFDQKFAELIVRECASIVLNGKYDYEKFNADDEFHRGFNQALDSATEGIKQHFGVEE